MTKEDTTKPEAAVQPPVEPVAPVDSTTAIEPFEQVLARLKAKVGREENKQVLAHLAADATRIAALALTDPPAADKELGFVRAASANLSVAEAQAVSLELTAWLAQFVRAVVLGA